MITFPSQFSIHECLDSLLAGRALEIFDGTWQICIHTKQKSCDKFSFRINLTRLYMICIHIIWYDISTPELRTFTVQESWSVKWLSGVQLLKRWPPALFHIWKPWKGHFQHFCLWEIWWVQDSQRSDILGKCFFCADK